MPSVSSVAAVSFKIAQSDWLPMTMATGAVGAGMGEVGLHGRRAADYTGGSLHRKKTAAGRRLTR
jgi:hypothetical protein